jgi:hypothetical protein
MGRNSPCYSVNSVGKGKKDPRIQTVQLSCGLAILHFRQGVLPSHLTFRLIQQSQALFMAACVQIFRDGRRKSLERGFLEYGKRIGVLIINGMEIEENIVGGAWGFDNATRSTPTAG